MYTLAKLKFHSFLISGSFLKNLKQKQIKHINKKNMVF